MGRCLHGVRPSLVGLRRGPYVPAQLIDGDDLACLALMAEAVHEDGALAGIELTHAGGQASTQGSCWPSLAPSQIVTDEYGISDG